ESMPAAFWWVAAEGHAHAQMRGKVRWVQVGSWYPTGSPDRERIRRTDPMAQFVDVVVKRDGDDRWQVRLALPSETVFGDVRTTSPAVPSKSPQPSYMSVPMSG